MYNRIGKQKYISPKMLMCGSYTDGYNSHSRHCWHRKEVLHISNLLFCTIKFDVCNRGGPGNTSRQYDIEFVRDEFFLCGYCIARNHDDKKSAGEKELSFLLLTQGAGDHPS